MDEKCYQCDAKLLGTLEGHKFYKCGRVMCGRGSLFTCDPRYAKTRCSADYGVMISFKDKLRGEE